MLYRIFVSAILMVLVAACAEPHDHEHDKKSDSHNHESDAGTHQEAHLSFSRDYLARFDTEFATTKPGIIESKIELPGSVQLDSDQVAHISPRFPAKIKQVYAKIGDTVKAGDNLALAESSETLARFNLISLIDGTIINRHIAQGEHLQPDDTAFVVANLKQVWVDITIYPHLLDQIKLGQQVTIKKLNSKIESKANIGYVAPVVDSDTRSGLARVFLNNQNGLWKPGSFVSASIVSDATPVNIAIPNSAIIEIDKQPHVFTQHENEWEATPIKLGLRGNTKSEVLSGLNQDQTYVSKGAFLLKAQLEKSEFESGHNH